MEAGKYQFGHERLDSYQLALSVARWASRQVLPPGRSHLRDQMVRAADSMVLNLAEGAGLDAGPSRRSHFRIAMGSAAELGAVLDLVDLPDGPGRQQDLRRVAAMLSRMSRS